MTLCSFYLLLKLKLIELEHTSICSICPIGMVLGFDKVVVDCAFIDFQPLASIEICDIDCSSNLNFGGGLNSLVFLNDS